MKKYTREISFFIPVFIVTLFVFMGRFLIFKESFITGDNLVQAFPWLNVFSDSIKAHRFPFWVTGVHCGFPLIGEGQVGGFYPFNILFFYLLPFRAAYNLSVIFHIFIAGIFTYLLTRKWGADRWGGFIASCVFCFGAAFANIGYHIGMMRALAWFPPVILLLEHYMEEEKLRYLGLSALFISFQILSGSVQMALYSIFFYFIYILAGAIKRKMNVLSTLTKFSLFLLIPFLVFLPQFLLTMQVVKNSGRISSLDFALWGSLNPLSILTSVLPGVFRFKGHISTEDIFLGAISVLFICAALFSRRSREKYGPLIAVSAVSVFMALGMFNPVYVLILKVLKFYTFRGPSRFIFFGLFFLSVLTGIGFSRFFLFKKEHLMRTSRMFLRYVFICISLAVSGGIFIFTCRPFITGAGRFIVDKFIAGAEYHRYGREVYYDKIDRIYSSIAGTISFTDRNMIITLLFLILTLFFVLFVRKYHSYMERNGSRRAIKAVAAGLIFFNLFAYKYYPGGYNNNVRDYDILNPYPAGIYDIIKNDKSLFRIMPYDIRSGALPVWSVPNTNMSFDINSIAVYSPLSSGVYRQRLDIFQVVDDSIGLKDPKSKLVHPSSLDLLRILNTKYIISAVELPSPGLSEIAREDNVFLYRLNDSLKKSFFSPDLNGRNVNDAQVKEIEYGPGYARFYANFDRDGYLVFSESYFPGWKAFINGKEVKIEKFRGLLQAVYCERGRSEVIFKYRPKM